MPEIPVTPSPDPPKSSPQPHDPPIQREGSQSPAPVTQGRRRLKKIFIPLVLSGLGLGLGLVAYFLVYPSPETGIPVPAYSKIYIETSVPILLASAIIDQGRIRVVVVLPEGAHAPPANAKEDIRIELPNGASFHNCSGCADYQSSSLFGLPSYATGKLTFSRKLFGHPSLSMDATVSFQVTPSYFGMDFDGSNAYAAIPEITLKGPRLEGYQLAANFLIPSASSYDWSSSSPTSVDSSSVHWIEDLKSGGMAGRTTDGINHAREANDLTLSFLAGALIGLAGGAILSAMQEALHIVTDSGAVGR